MTPSKSTPKDVFLHLMMFSMLYVSVVSFLTLLFQYVNVLLPDQLSTSYYYGGIFDAIRFASSSLIVAFPVFILLSWMLEKDFRKEAEQKERRVRKWLVYLTLFVAAITIIIDLIRLIYNFYQGELTVSFLLKILSVLLVTAGVFGYYLWDLRIGTGGQPKRKWTAIGTSLLVAVVIVSGFFIAGSPAHQRQVRFDEQRTQALQSLQYEIIAYWQKKGTLPMTLAQLQNDISGYYPPTDPKTNEPYEYETTGELSFRLCATFETAVEEPLLGPQRTPYPTEPFGMTDKQWSHDMGRTCFDRTIDPDLYKLDQPIPVK